MLGNKQMDSLFVSFYTIDLIDAIMCSGLTCSRRRRNEVPFISDSTFGARDASFSKYRINECFCQPEKQNVREKEKAR